MRQMLMAFALTLAACGGDDGDCGAGDGASQALTLVYPVLKFEPTHVTLTAGTSTASPTEVYLRNVGSGTAVVEDLWISDPRIDVSPARVQVFPGAEVPLEVRFVAEPGASLDGVVRARVVTSEACGLWTEAELSVTSP